MASKPFSVYLEEEHDTWTEVELKEDLRLVDNT